MEGYTKGPWVWAKPQAPCSAPHPWLPFPGPHLAFSSQGLTGPIGPPGPAGANGEKVSHGPLHSAPIRSPSHLPKTVLSPPLDRQLSSSSSPTAIRSEGGGLLSSRVLVVQAIEGSRRVGDSCLSRCPEEGAGVAEAMRKQKTGCGSLLRPEPPPAVRAASWVHFALEGPPLNPHPSSLAFVPPPQP